MTFNPAAPDFGLWPYNGSKPTLTQGMSGTVGGVNDGIGQAIGYLVGSLHFASGQPVAVPALPGPYYFGSTVAVAVRNFQLYWGLTLGPVDSATWGVIDYVNFLTGTGV